MITLTTSQKIVFEKIKTFLDNGSDIFVLQGYAGTGKTTMIKFIVDYLCDAEKSFQIMAPTGRAAKVLRSKVNNGHTIHSLIYSKSLECKEVESEDKSKKSYKFYFPLIELSSGVHTVIVDESSMISNNESHNEFFSFGSGKLLTDLLDYIRKTGVKKLIFVGDGAQLPPVGDSRSKAFDIDFLTGKGFSVETAEMTEVIRQANDSPILQTATDIRQLLAMPASERYEFCIKPNGSKIIEIEDNDLAKKYVDEFPVPQVGNGVVVCYSNNKCYQNNRCIRDLLFPGNDGATLPGDILLINANNYSAFDFPIFNGDMVIVTDVGQDIVHSNIPVTIGGEKRHITLTFRNVSIQLPELATPIECLISIDLLDSKERDLSVWQQRALYIDFCMRTSTHEGSEEFKKALSKDAFFNCIKAKYGYAITCHKAQGGEWDTVFVDYSGRSGLDNDSLRWCYTATTRASNRLMLINAPSITSFSKFKMSSIVRIGKAPKEFWGKEQDIECPFHTGSSVPMAVKLKCLGIIDQLENTRFKLLKVASCNYQEKYFFVDDADHLVHIDAWYDGSGIFKPLLLTGDSQSDFLRNVINTALRQPEDVDYSPSYPPLLGLWQVMQPLCEMLEIKITNVLEDLTHYNVIYCLKTDARFALIQFYISGGKLKTALPKSELGEEDQKLVQLINILS